MDIKLIVALIGISGVAMSAIIQYYLGSRTEKGKKAIEIRTQAYLDLLNSVAEIASSSKNSENRSIDQFQKLTQAKTRVVLIGSDEVVSKVHTFFSEFGLLDTNESFMAFSEIVSAMRVDLTGKNRLELKVLSESLFGSNSKA